MELVEIKKALYKQKPKATLLNIIDDCYCYRAMLVNGYRVNFKVPLEEGENFEKTINGQLLIRWIENEG